MEMIFNKLFEKFTRNLGYDHINDFELYIRTIKSRYKKSSMPPTIRIKIGENDSDKFLGKAKTEPEIGARVEIIWIYSPIEKIKNKIK